VKRTIYSLTAMTVAMLAILATLSAHAQEHPAFGTVHRTYMSVEAEVADIGKLETRAIDILVKPDHGGLTRDEARSKLRVDGKTDVARCLEVIYAYQLRIITQARVTASAIANQHPSAPLE
jgi:hypothetical protein